MMKNRVYWSHCRATLKDGVINDKENKRKKGAKCQLFGRAFEYPSEADTNAQTIFFLKIIKHTMK